VQTIFYRGIHNFVDLGTVYIMRIVIVTDAWEPQINGVVTTLSHVAKTLEKEHDVLVVEPGLFKSIPLWPYYPEIKVAYDVLKVGRVMKDFKPDSIHIATEGPLGVVARNFCLRKKWSFTTSFHTKFPEYIRKRVPIPLNFSYEWFRRFHSAADTTLVTTESIKKELMARKFKNLITWTRGIDRKIFHPGQLIEDYFPKSDKKIKNLLFVGRVAEEKNIRSFCELSRLKQYQCWVVGDGPQRQELEEEYAGKVHFLGYKYGEVLAQHYAGADVCVFPSKTDTFGITIIESMACGTPVAGFPVPGPKDLVIEGVSGSVDEDLKVAVKNCLEIPRERVPDYTIYYTWEKCALIFEEHLVPLNSGKNVDKEILTLDDE